ncbi:MULTISPECIES: hypothetical protein [Turicibacter]|jgi:hypothetical protein|uniref:hypothetical protein n=1 Tax=Turicibacter TaxID=191303 RepID=UPI0001FDB002|nr:MULTISPECIES: hypothetical protein [Turicibacter]EGC92192.1 hypothetical protein HMPREF9402_0996 [Turicibacter sp. HGF1]MBP3903062.1 hypothetical protein [Turicibacter sp.]MCU7197421.1 hypothetical protein [Turicibacter sanguinis]MCU7202011.1 hypothetical protein [Turicibacter sanguinis]MCU7211899.1 hypothetical protein [Turicibacter sanguinis]
MNINKAIYKSEQLVSLYGEQQNEGLLEESKKLNRGIDSKAYLSTIKYLYLYQYYKTSQTFPSWYSTLMQKKINDLYDYFEKTFANIINKHGKVDEELESFLSRRVVWLYKGNFRVYPTSPVDYLPLELRLKVYVYLYGEEDDPKASCHLRNRIAVTLAKLGHLDLANLFSIYNWLMAQGINTHFAKSSNLKTTLSQLKHANEYNKKLQQEGQSVPLVTELCFYFTKLLNRQLMKYDRANVAMIDLVAFYYKQYPQLEQLSLPFKTYLRTKDMKELRDKVEQKRGEFIKATNEVTSLIEDQVTLYNFILRICI